MDLTAISNFASASTAVEYSVRVAELAQDQYETTLNALLEGIDAAPEGVGLRIDTYA